MQTHSRQIVGVYCNPKLKKDLTGLCANICVKIKTTELNNLFRELCAIITLAKVSSRTTVLPVSLLHDSFLLASFFLFWFLHDSYGLNDWKYYFEASLTVPASWRTNSRIRRRNFFRSGHNFIKTVSVVPSRLKREDNFSECKCPSRIYDLWRETFKTY